MLFSICRKVEPVEIQQRMAKGVNLGARPAWAETVAMVGEALRDLPHIYERRNYLAMRLPSGQGAGAGTALGAAASLFGQRYGLPARPIPSREIEARVQEVRERDAQSPMALLEPNERAVADLLAAGLSNEQIAKRLGFRDKRTVARTNGQIYAAWGLNDTATDEKIARTRAAIVVREGRLISWDARGKPWTFTASGERAPFQPSSA